MEQMWNTRVPPLTLELSRAGFDRPKYPQKPFLWTSSPLRGLRLPQPTLSSPTEIDYLFSTEINSLMSSSPGRLPLISTSGLVDKANHQDPSRGCCINCNDYTGYEGDSAMG